MEQVRLIAPPGCDEASYGEHRFKVHDDGTVEVPMEAVEGLMHTGGFALAEHHEHRPSLGFAFMRGLAGAAHCSWGRENFERTSRGCFAFRRRPLLICCRMAFSLSGRPQ